MKFLVLGCNGMAGHMVSIYLLEQGYDVVGLARKENKMYTTINADVTDFDRLKRIICEGDYDIVVNCVGILNQYAEMNKAQAILTNSYLPHFLAGLTNDSKTRIIHISTDCVFSGKRGNYGENDLRDGSSFYDRTKALGELEDRKNVTLRNSIVGPDINVNGIGLLNWFMKETICDGAIVNGYLNSIWTGQTTLQLAKTIEAVAFSNPVGIYNMVPDTSITKYELLMLFNEYLRKGKVKINPIDNEKVDKSLVRTNKDFDFNIPDYRCMIAEMAEWIDKHKNLYSHYYQ